MRRPQPPRRSPVALAVAALLAVVLAGPAAAAQRDDALAQARRLLDERRAEEALAVVETLLAERPDDAEALLLRSTARFLDGEVEAGRRDLARALELDPGLREGWLNLAGLAVAEERYEDALAAFERAERLDPSAAENDLNVGTALLLAGRLEPASERFGRYLEGAGGTATGYFLVAKNYALGGYAALAVEHLRRAIALDERARVQAKSDPAFAALADHPRLAELLTRDDHLPAPGDHGAARDFAAAYAGGHGPLLNAVLDALQLGGHRFDARVEVTPDWALVWGRARIKVTDGPQGGRLELTAPAASFGAGEWAAFQDELFRSVAARLALSAPRQP